MTWMQGRIIKGIGGFYYVLTEEQTLYECRGCGKFRLEKITPLAGDWVHFEVVPNTKTGCIYEIEERKNQLLRPPVANVDMFMLVISASVPKPDFMLCDKLLIQAEREHVAASIVINKCDEADESIIKAIQEAYGEMYSLFFVSAKASENIDALRASLCNKISCLSGQSAVGKSSLINELCVSLQLETGGLSKKTDRGRHTTRETTLLKLENEEGYVVDTPGFSLLDLGDLPAESIQSYYADIASYAKDCRFQNCLHLEEPSCAVKQAVQAGKIQEGRYMRYRLLTEEQQKKEKQKYR